MFEILLLHGLNLNFLGGREPGIYGTVGFDEIDGRMKRVAEENGCELRVFQSNSEGRVTLPVFCVDQTSVLSYNWYHRVEDYETIYDWSQQSHHRQVYPSVGE